MLLNDLYTIADIHKKETFWTAKVTINPTHDIFAGHFPTQAVLPGVCLLEMLKDVVAEALGHKYNISQAGNIKYLKIVDPTVEHELKFELTITKVHDSLKVSAASYLADGSANFKFKGALI